MARPKKSLDSECVKKRDIKYIKEEIKAEIIKKFWNRILSVLFAIAFIYTAINMFGGLRADIFGFETFIYVVGMVTLYFGTAGLSVYFWSNE